MSDIEVLRQYREVQDDYPHAIVLRRVGDSYEAYGVNAFILAKELGLTLTRNFNVLRAGIPTHSKDRILAQLFEANPTATVVIIDQDCEFGVTQVLQSPPQSCNTSEA